MAQEHLRMTAGRGIALAVGVPIALALIGWTSLDLVALIGEGSYQVSSRLPVLHHVVTANISGGDLSVRSVPGNTALLTGTVHYSLIKPHLRLSSTGVTFRCELPVGDCDMSGTLAVPPGTAIHLSTGGGNMTVSGFAGNVTVNSGGGDLTAENLSGDLVMTTGGGDIDGEGLADPHVVMQTGGGDISLVFSQAPLALSITTGGGNIDVTLPHNSNGYDLHTSTGGGDVSIDPTVHVNTSSPDVVTLTSGGGDISVTEAAGS